jgi:hypothetical protein
MIWSDLRYCLNQEGEVSPDPDFHVVWVDLSLHSTFIKMPPAVVGHPQVRQELTRTLKYPNPTPSNPSTSADVATAMKVAHAAYYACRQS